MKRLSLPQPPDPDEPRYKNNALAYNRAAYEWMAKVKGLAESAHNLAAAPCGQQLQVASFTTNTAISGTSTGTDVVNFLCSLVQTLTNKGIISPSITIGDTQ
jgi:hypothetical protein